VEKDNRIDNQELEDKGCLLEKDKGITIRRLKIKGGEG